MGISAGIMAIGSLAGSAYTVRQQGRAADKALQQQKDSAAQAEANRPQASKAPGAQDVQAGLAGAGQGGGAPGVAQTFLTGAGGIDNSLLTLGKTTLLGG